jgi:outer membrane protein OmpA-like peptidoglycan-associated protein
MISHRQILLSTMLAAGSLSGCVVDSRPTTTLPTKIVDPRYLVFFEWGGDYVNQQGMEIISRAAAFATDPKWRFPKLVVDGYADRSGHSAANVALSKRRAEKVVDGLVGLGVSRDNIAVSWHGEQDNRVPTAHGVREPQNRRVEIVFP